MADAQRQRGHLPGWMTVDANAPGYWKQMQSRLEDLLNDAEQRLDNCPETEPEPEANRIVLLAPLQIGICKIGVQLESDSQDMDEIRKKTLEADLKKAQEELERVENEIKSVKLPGKVATKN